jgi:KDO2-lipid IV(A) lauroyltransferase
MAKLFWKKGDDSPFLHRLGLRLEAGMLRMLWWIVAPLSARRASALGARFMGWLGPRTAKHRHVLANLRMALPDRSEEEIDRLATGVWRNLGSMLAEFPHLKTITDMQRADPAIEIVIKNPDPEFVTGDKPYIFIAAHLGNLDLSAFCVQHLGHPIDVVYNPLSNPYLEEMVQRERAPLNCGFIEKKNALRNMLKRLKQGHSIGLHVDVRVEDGELYPFFGADATTTTAPAWLAVKTGYDIVPVRTERTGPLKFRFTVYPALQRPPADLDDAEAIRELTLEMNRFIAGLIAEVPAQWLCTKRRWPKDIMMERGAYRK